jgi:hypothetical protein
MQVAGIQDGLEPCWIRTLELFYPPPRVGETAGRCSAGTFQQRVALAQEAAQDGVDQPLGGGLSQSRAGAHRTVHDRVRRSTRPLQLIQRDQQQRLDLIVAGRLVQRETQHLPERPQPATGAVPKVLDGGPVSFAQGRMACPHQSQHRCQAAPAQNL